jgi:hypothetical protein
MRTPFIAALLATLLAASAAPAFASGYGPAPFYKPSSGAPASQRGQSAQNLASSYGDVQQDYGGEFSSRFQAGDRSMTALRDTLYSHR